MPPGTELGIDYNTWYVGPNFRGVKDIPSGLHFIFTSMVDQQKRHAPRNGQFLYFLDDSRTKGVVLRSKWDEQNEELYSPFTECKIEDVLLGMRANFPFLELKFSAVYFLLTRALAQSNKNALYNNKIYQNVAQKYEQSQAPQLK